MFQGTARRAGGTGTAIPVREVIQLVRMAQALNREEQDQEQGTQSQAGSIVHCSISLFGKTHIVYCDSDSAERFPDLNGNGCQGL